MNIPEAITTTYGTEAVLDGILNPELYANAPIRILWILRESWFKDAWRLLQAEGVYSRIGNSPTLHPMAYITYSALNGYQSWEDMSYLRDNPDMADELRRTAYINVKKTVGGTSSNRGVIYTWFQKGAPIIREQIKEYNPHVVIGCPPFMHDIFQWYPSKTPPITEGYVTYTRPPNGPLLIEAPHPSHRGKRSTYVDSIIAVIKAQLAREDISRHP